MNKKIVIVGIGYVGLSLLMLFRKKINVAGYDKNTNRINELLKGYDTNFSIRNNDFKRLNLFNKESDLKNFNTFIITLPTPLTKNNKPDLSNLINFTKKLCRHIKPKDYVIFESTYAPFTTNNILKKIIEKKTKFKEGKDFFIGYSPERINPGISLKKTREIVKLVSANNVKTTNYLNRLYRKAFNKVINCNSIEIAESSKIIENVQRDLNIAFFNELSRIFIKLKINPKEIFKSAKSKWNFINMNPGIVGGHCLPVDPYYFTEFLKKRNIRSDFLISGRKINEDYVRFVSLTLRKYLLKDKTNKKILFLGCTYKKNVGDFRSSKSLKIIKYFISLRKYKIKVYDPYIKKNNKIFSNKKINSKKYKVIVKLVDHDIFHKNYHKIKKKIIDASNINDIFRLTV